MSILRSQLQENMAQKAKGDGSPVVAAGYNWVLKILDKISFLTGQRTES